MEGAAAVTEMRRPSIEEERMALSLVQPAAKAAKNRVDRMYFVVFIPDSVFFKFMVVCVYQMPPSP